MLKHNFFSFSFAQRDRQIYIHVDTHTHTHTHVHTRRHTHTHNIYIYIYIYIYNRIRKFRGFLSSLVNLTKFKESVEECREKGGGFIPVLRASA